MAIIRLPREFGSVSTVLSYSSLWDNSKNASYRIPPDLSGDEVLNYLKFLIPHISHPLWSGVLADLAERKISDWGILQDIYVKGDVGCKVAVCLRHDIPIEFLQQCLKSEIEEVIEHAVFNPNVKIDDLEILLASDPSPKIKEAITRAIESKK